MEIKTQPSNYDLKLKQSNVSNKEDMIDRDINNALHKIAKKEGYISFKVNKEIISTDGGNFLGVLQVADITGKTADGEKETNIFIKTMLLKSDNVDLFSITDVYNKELYFYKELKDIIKELQDEANVPSTERFKMVKSYNESTKNMIILENMVKKGFSTFHRMDDITLNFAELAVKELAKLHGIFYVVQHKRKEYFVKKLQTLKHAYNFDGQWADFVAKVCKISMKPLENQAKEKINKFIPVFVKKYQQYMEDAESVGCTICHGDYKANNILMKSENGEVTEVVPVDYQLMYYGCPLLDFIYLMFTGTDQEFRRAHMEDLKNLYYQSLGEYLKYFDMEVEMVIPRRQFDRLYKEKLDYGLMMALISQPFMFAYDDDIPDFSKDEIFNVSMKLDKRFEKRIIGAVDDFISWGYL